MKKIVIFILALIGAGCLAAVVWHFLAPGKTQAPAVSNAPAQQSPAPSKPTFDKTKYSIDTPGSIWWIVGKKRPLPEGYIPSDLVTPNVTLNSVKSKEENSLQKDTAKALEDLYVAAKKDGFELMLASGYRSYSQQKIYHDSYAARDGQEAADRYSARPGTSEHQTGLSLDVSTVDRKVYLEQAFGEEAAGKWLAAHVNDYGFIIRYPEGKEAVTGYTYEPWHIRYVGKELAAEMKRTNISTLEEFFGL